MKKILKNTWAVLTGKEKKKFTFLVLLDIVISIMDIISLAILLWIIQFYIQPGDGKNLSFLPGSLRNNDSIWLVSFFFIFFTLKNITGYFIAKAHYQFNSGVAIRISRNNLLQLSAHRL